ncbi:MAG TPA: LysR family transcriptional regulator [Chroococcidiopsis sp.]
MDLDTLSQVELRQICYFLILVQSGNNFSEAAKRVGIQQPPFSQRIQALEKTLSKGKNAAEVKLLDRSTQPATLTEAGKAFLQEAELALMHLDRAIFRARQASQGKIGRLTIGIHNSIANSILPQVLQDFQRQYPDVELELREVTILEELPLLQTHQIDVVFRRSPSQHDHDPSLSAIPILAESFVLVLPEHHALSSRSTISLIDLKDESIILPSLGALPFYQQVIDQCRAAGFEPQIATTISATGIVTLLSLVAANLGVGILPSHVERLHREGVAYRPIRDLTLTRAIAAVWRQDDHSQVLHNFLKLIQQRVQAL